MKIRHFISVLILFCLSLHTADARVTVSLDWTKETALPTGGTMFDAAFSPTYDQFFITDFSNGEIFVASATGEFTGETLDVSGLESFDPMRVCGITVADDRTIYAGIYNDNASKSGLLVWNNKQSSVRVQFPVEEMYFPRAMHAVGSGTATLIAIAGENVGGACLLSTTDGIDFLVTAQTKQPIIIPAMIKQDIVLAASKNRLYGAKADGTGEVSCHVKVSNDEWVPLDTFAPPRSYDSPDRGGLGAAALTGYSDALNAVFTVGYSQESLSVLDGETGERLDNAPIDKNIAVYGYGSIWVDDTNKKGYFGARSQTQGNAIFGQFSFEGTPSTRTPTWTPTDIPTQETHTATPTWTPTATPTIGPNIPDYNSDAAVDNYDLLQLMSRFGATGGNAAQVDLNDDHRIDSEDIFRFALWWKRDLLAPTAQ